MIDFFNDNQWILGWLHTSFIFIFLIFIYSLFFVVRAGVFPSFSRSKRRHQILKSYFPLPGHLVIKKANIRRFTNTPSWIVFQKDAYYDKFISGYSSVASGKPEEMKEFFSQKKDLENRKFDNRILVFEDSDFGILTSFVAFFWPISKVFEIEGPKDIRLMGVDIFDLDNDSSQEFIIYWLTYNGGSGGNFFPLVIKLNDDNENDCVSFPLLQTVDASMEIKEEKPEKYDLKVNGKSYSITISQIHTDHFWIFKRNPEDEKYKLIFAYAQGDWDFHYGTQSWNVISYKYQNGQFFIDSNFIEPFLLSKDKGVTLKEMHGYEIIPVAGMLFPIWSESWKNIDTNDQPFNDMKIKSRIFKILDEKQKMKKL